MIQALGYVLLIMALVRLLWLTVDADRRATRSHRADLTDGQAVKIIAGPGRTS